MIEGNFDLFDKQVDNCSLLITGCDNEARTAAICKIIEDNLKKQTCVIISTDNNKYAHLVSKQGGCTYFFDTAAPFCLNPYRYVDEVKDDDLFVIQEWFVQILRAILPLYPLVLKHNLHLSEMITFSVEKAISKSGESVEIDGVVTEFRSLSRNQTDQEIILACNEAYKALSHFCGSGKYSEWFSNESRLLSFDDPFIEINYSQILGNSSLLKPILTAVSGFLVHAWMFLSTRKDRRVVVFDKNPALYDVVGVEDTFVLLLRQRRYCGCGFMNVFDSLPDTHFGKIISVNSVRVLEGL